MVRRYTPRRASSTRPQFDPAKAAALLEELRELAHIAYKVIPECI